MRMSKAATAAVKVRHGGVTIRREPLGSDLAAEVPRDQWGELLDARREFCVRKVPHDCRLLLFFIQDAAANNWLDLGGRDEYIRALKLEPQMVEWALDGLKATRPDVAVEFEAAVKLGKNGGVRVKQSSVTRPLGKQCNAAYIRARLERDGYTELLARVESGEVTANAAAIAMGWRPRMASVTLTVDGFAHAIERHLSPKQQAELYARQRKEGTQ